MEQNQNFNLDQELGWEDEITADSSSFVLLPEGEYEFTVKGVERGRFNGSEKMRPSNMAIVTCVINYQGQDVEIKNNLILNKKIEWRISQFFESIGMKKKGEPLHMQWNLGGWKGRCKVGPREYNGNKYNEIKSFIPREDVQQPQAQPQQQASGFNWGN